MERKFKHRKTGEIAYYKDGVFKQGRFAVEIGYEPSKEYWEEIIENRNPLNLEVGKTYTVLYKHYPSNLIKVKITRFTTMGHPWGEFENGSNGIVTDCYKVIQEPKKEYEILDWSYGHNHELITKNPDGTAKEYRIYSIRRVSDGRVFNVGDKVKNFFTDKRTGTINYFKFVEDIKTDVIGMKAYSFNIGKLFACVDNNIGTHLISELEHSSVLFITEDGIEVREGDKYFYVDEQCEIFVSHKAISTSGQDPILKYFSTEKAALNYIKYNKPVLSYNDIWNSTTNKSSDTLYIVISKKQLTDLVKSKL